MTEFYSTSLFPTDFMTRIDTIVKASKNVIERVDLGLVDLDEIELNCFVSFECDDDDDLADFFQAAIDVISYEMVHGQEIANTTFRIRMLFPGYVSEESMYELGDIASINYDDLRGIVKVSVMRNDSNKIVKYCYDLKDFTLNHIFDSYL